MDNKWLSREFLAFVILAALATVLALNGTLAQERWEQWQDFMKWIGGAFIISRGLAKFQQVGEPPPSKE